jgi:hypothetical protein
MCRIITLTHFIRLRIYSDLLTHWCRLQARPPDYSDSSILQPRQEILITSQDRPTFSVEEDAYMLK